MNRQIALGGISLLTPLTGIGQYTYHLADELTKLNWDVQLFLGDHWASFNETSDNKQSNTNLRSNILLKILKKIRHRIPNANNNLHQLRQLAFSKGIKNFTHPFSLYHEPNFIPWKTSHPTIITVHDLSWIRHPNTHPHDRIAWLNKHLPNALRESDQIITVSNFVTQEIIDVFGSSLESKISTIYNGVSQEFRMYNKDESLKILSDYELTYQNYVLVLGTIEPRKNIATVLRAYQLLPEKVKEQYPLVLAGNRGWLNDELDQLIQAINPKYLKLIGYVPQNHLPTIISGARVSVYASIYEGFGLPVIESMASGTPVIISKASSLIEVANGAALACDSNDVESFKEYIMHIIENNESHEKYRKLGLERARFFNWTETAKQTALIYKNFS